MENLKLIEDGLIKVYKTDMDEYVVDGRELWQGLGSKQKFTDWVNGRLIECDATENREFFISLGKTSGQGGRPSKEYIVKLDTAKEMAMLERNEMGKQYRRYLIEVEKKYKQQSLPTPVVSQADEIMAEVKLKNARMREANLLMKVAVHLDLMEQKQVYRKSAELLMGERLRQHDELQVLGRKLHYISTVDADQDALYACQELKSGVITVMVNARSFGEENDLRQKCMMMLEEQAPMGCLAEGIVVR